MALARKLTGKQLDVLLARPAGHCVRGSWQFVWDGEVVTRQVRALEARGLLDVDYYAGLRAGTSLTEQGRTLLAGAA